MSLVVVFLVLVVLLISVIATIACVKSSVLSAQQKWMQVGVIWLLPVVGGVISLLMSLEGRLKYFPGAEPMQYDDAWNLAQSDRRAAIDTPDSHHTDPGDT
jgi:hypothetical protein